MTLFAACPTLIFRSAVLAGIGRMSYQPEDAADAWQRIFAFFGTYLQG